MVLVAERETKFRCGWIEPKHESAPQEEPDDLLNLFLLIALQDKNQMIAGSMINEVISPIPPSRFWNAIVKDSHNLLPKLFPEVISSIINLQGDGGVGTTRQCNFTGGIIKEYSYWKDRVDGIDEEKHVSRYTVIEGGLIGKKVESTCFELNFEVSGDGGSICRLHAEFEAYEDSFPTYDETKEMMASMMKMFNAVEAYLLAYPHAYA